MLPAGLPHKSIDLLICSLQNSASVSSSWSQHHQLDRQDLLGTDRAHVNNVVMYIGELDTNMISSLTRFSSDSAQLR